MTRVASAARALLPAFFFVHKPNKDERVTSIRCEHETAKAKHAQH